MPADREDSGRTHLEASLALSLESVRFELVQLRVVPHLKVAFDNLLSALVSSPSVQHVPISPYRLHLTRVSRGRCDATCIEADTD